MDSPVETLANLKHLLTTYESSRWSIKIEKLQVKYQIIVYHFNKICIYLIYIRVAYDKVPDIFVWTLLLIVHTWNSSSLRSNLLRLQCTCCTIPKTSGRPHWSPLVWACQWPSSQPLCWGDRVMKVTPSPQLSHNDNLWA